MVNTDRCNSVSSILKYGFTLVEVLIVVTILSILAVLVVPRFNNAVSETQDAACEANVHQINNQIMYYHTREGAWPDDLTDVTENKSYFPHNVPQCPYGVEYIYNTDAHLVEDHDDEDHK